MSTDYTPTQLELQGFGRRKLVAEFDGGRISSDGGLPLLAAVERRRQLISRFAQCFTDARDPRWVEHSVEELVGQRVLGLALGYEDLIDHDELRSDPLLAAVVGRAQCGTIRLRLLKIGARIRVSVRRIKVSLASGHPYQAPFRQAWHRLTRAGPPVPA